jgi:hypothetical protein
MAKPESNFIARIHRRLTTDIYKQAMGLTSTNGTPDYYYEGVNGCLWIEYKWYPEKPLTIDLTDKKKKPHLSALQRLWLNRAIVNGVDAIVVAGYPGTGCFILEFGAWNHKITDTRKYDFPILKVIDRIHEIRRGRTDRG